MQHSVVFSIVVLCIINIIQKEQVYSNRSKTDTNISTLYCLCVLRYSDFH